MIARLFSYSFNTSIQNYPTREGLILQWGDGFGEIAPLSPFSKETLDEAREEILSLLPNLHHPSRHPSVRWAIACASVPFSLEPLHIPLCSLYRNDCKNRDFGKEDSQNLHFDIHVPKTPTLKLKIGHLHPREAVSYVRQFLGKYTLRLDCNRAWTLEEACHFASNFSKEDFDYLEEPVQTVSELIRFSELTAFPLAIDESITESYSLMPPTLKALVWKPSIHGIPPQDSPYPLVLSSAYESSLGLLQIARIPNSLPRGLDTFSLFKEDLLTPPLTINQGHLSWSPSNHFPIDFSKLQLIAETE
ncbi:MAG: hypothetical protein HY861_04140 [Chlamydiia bacterium]|nr:hypothetical protein [Chlamydiia bacterium]